jgi:nitrogen regulatory protein PII
MSDGQASDQSLTLEASQVITCILPDEGIHRMLILDLLHEKGITRVESTPCRGIAALREARTKKGRLPTSTLVQMINVVVSVTEAEALFEYIYEKARIGRPGGGMLLLGKPIESTPFSLPQDVLEETH